MEHAGDLPPGAAELVAVLADYAKAHDHLRRVQRMMNQPQRAATDPEVSMPSVREIRHLTDQSTAALVAAYESGATVYELAEQFSIHRDRVSKIVREAGVETRYHERAQVDLDRVDELKRHGLNLYQIAEALGVSRTSIVRARQRARQDER